MAYLTQIAYFTGPQTALKEIKSRLTDLFDDLKQGTITASDYGLAAARKLDFDFNEEINALLFTSEGSDYNGPQTSVWLHKQLISNQANVLCLDVPGGCTGFIHQLMVAKSLLKSAHYTKILGVLGEIVTRVIHPEDKNLIDIFSDAGAAILVQNKPTEFSARIGEFVVGTDSSGFESLIVRRSGIREPIDKMWLEKYANIGGLPYGRLEMDEKAVFLFVYKVVPKLVKEILDKNNLTFEDIDLFVFHQANGQLLEMLQKKLKIPNSKFFTNFEVLKNSVSCSIPIALKQAMEQERIKKGNKVLIAGFGIGFTWGGTVLFY